MVNIGTCTACSAERWDILGDSAQGYVLMQNSKHCLKREGPTGAAVMQNCDDGYSSFALQVCTNNKCLLILDL